LIISPGLKNEPFLYEIDDLNRNTNSKVNKNIKYSKDNIKKENLTINLRMSEIDSYTSN